MKQFMTRNDFLRLMHTVEPGDLISIRGANAQNDKLYMVFRVYPDSMPSNKYIRCVVYDHLNKMHYNNVEIRYQEFIEYKVIKCHRNINGQREYLEEHQAG